MNEKSQHSKQVTHATLHNTQDKLHIISYPQFSAKALIRLSPIRQGSKNTLSFAKIFKYKADINIQLCSFTGKIFSPKEFKYLTL